MVRLARGTFESAQSVAQHPVIPADRRGRDPQPVPVVRIYRPEALAIRPLRNVGPLLFRGISSGIFRPMSALRPVGQRRPAFAFGLPVGGGRLWDAPGRPRLEGGPVALPFDPCTYLRPLQFSKLLQPEGAGSETALNREMPGPRCSPGILSSFSFDPACQPSMTSPVSTSRLSTVSSPSRYSTVMREPGSTWSETIFLLISVSTVCWRYRRRGRAP